MRGCNRRDRVFEKSGLKKYCISAIMPQLKDQRNYERATSKKRKLKYLPENEIEVFYEALIQ